MAKAARLPEHVHEDFLDHVLGAFRVVGHLQAETVDAAVVAFEQGAETRRIAVRHPFDQLFIRDCLHGRSRSTNCKDTPDRETLHKKERYTMETRFDALRL